ncbi:MAG: PLD nuclease N-terminal domain-containing protein [Terrimesophilobacter sp.]
MRAFLTIASVALAIGFWVYAVVDCVVTDARRARGISKPAWVLVTIFLSVVGGVLWFLLGKERNALGGARATSGAPDDDPTFLRSLSVDAEQAERIRRLEEEIAELDDDSHDK